VTGLAVRPPVVAGSFYPARAAELAGLVDALLGEAEAPTGRGASPVPRALIVPHAGYRYSGPIAASGYRCLRPAATPIERVVVAGPSHFWPLEGTAVPATDRWATPLGEVALDDDARRTALDLGARLDDRPHGQEHAIEVQLPFLQCLLPGQPVLPLAVGDTAAGSLADLLAALAAMPRTLLVVSTDLSHYHDQAAARRLDRRTADAVLDRDPAAVRLDDACGAWALRGLLELARRERLGIRLLDLRTSADTAGDPDRVVGYGAFRVDDAG